jgi:outer membrane protein assembly factor BamB
VPTARQRSATAADADDRTVEGLDDDMRDGSLRLEPRWTFALPKERRVGARRPVVSDGFVYVAFFHDRGGFTESRLIAFEQDSGKQAWSYVVDHVGNEPVVSGGTTFWSSFEGSVHALDAQGHLQWKGPGTRSNIGIPVADDARVVVAEIAGGSATTWCLDRRTGATVWRFDHGGHAHPIAMAGGRIFHSSVAPTRMDDPPSCTLHCISAQDGRSLWSRSADEHFFNPVVLEDRLYVCSNRALLAFGAGDGKPLGELMLESNRTAFRLSAGLDAHRLYVCRDSHGQGADTVRAIDLGVKKGWFGREKIAPRVAWSLPEERGLCWPPVELPAGNLVYLTHDGVLCLVDATSGAVIAEKQLKTRPSTFGGIAVSGDRLVVSHGRDLFGMTIADR